MKLFYCLRNKYDVGLLVGLTDEEGQEAAFQERFLRDGQNAYVGLLFGPKVVRSFLAYTEPVVVRSAPLSDLRGYTGDPKEWLQMLPEAWSHMLLSDAAREVFIADVLGNLHLEDVPTLATREAQP